jgi:hypothetical protein
MILIGLEAPKNPAHHLYGRILTPGILLEYSVPHLLILYLLSEIYSIALTRWMVGEIF